MEVLMSRSIRLLLALTLLLSLTVATVATASAGGRKVLDSSMAAVPVANMPLNGLTGGGVPWVIENGHVQLFEDGRLHVDIAGLVIPDRVPPNPITAGKAILTCSNVPVAETGLVPFSPEGDATIDTVIDLPAQCLAPAV